LVVQGQDADRKAWPRETFDERGGAMGGIDEAKERAGRGSLNSCTTRKNSAVWAARSPRCLLEGPPVTWVKHCWHARFAGEGGCAGSSPSLVLTFVEMFVGCGCLPVARRCHRPRKTHRVNRIHRRNRCRGPVPVVAGYAVATTAPNRTIEPAGWLKWNGFEGERRRDHASPRRTARRAGTLPCCVGPL